MDFPNGVARWLQIGPIVFSFKFTAGMPYFSVFQSKVLGLALIEHTGLACIMSSFVNQ